MNYRKSNIPPDWTTLTTLAGSIFRTLRFIPHGHGVPLKVKQPSPVAGESPYAHFFNVYKPNTPYKKTDPPVPDFAISVVR
jgi:tRNA-splicing endonuclease subunit Sen54